MEQKNRELSQLSHKYIKRECFLTGALPDAEPLPLAHHAEASEWIRSCCIIISQHIMLKATSQSSEVANKRQIYKKEKLEECSEIFYCQCGKNYLTFSALYLHARNKHNVKLTTKRSSQNCKIEVRGTQNIVTYFTLPPPPPKHPSTPFNPPPSSPIQSPEVPSTPSLTSIQLIDSYLSQDRTTLQPADSEVLSKFRSYLERVKEMQGCWQTRDVSCFFNDFLVFYLPESNGGQTSRWLWLLRQAPGALLKFNSWLLARHYTTWQVCLSGQYAETLTRNNN